MWNFGENKKWKKKVISFHSFHPRIMDGDEPKMSAADVWGRKYQYLLDKRWVFPNDSCKNHESAWTFLVLASVQGLSTGADACRNCFPRAGITCPYPFTASLVAHLFSSLAFAPPSHSFPQLPTHRSKMGRVRLLPDSLSSACLLAQPILYCHLWIGDLPTQPAYWLHFTAVRP